MYIWAKSYVFEHFVYLNFVEFTGEKCSFHFAIRLAHVCCLLYFNLSLWHFVRVFASHHIFYIFTAIAC